MKLFYELKMTSFLKMLASAKDKIEKKESISLNFVNMIVVKYKILSNLSQILKNIFLFVSFVYLADSYK